MKPIVCCLALFVILPGCKESSRDTAAPPGQPKPKGGQSFGYFQTHFQDESQFIVENVAADLAELIHYARNRSLPANEFSVQAAEASGSQFRAPVYQLRIALGGKTAPLQSEVKVDAPIWSPHIYATLADDLAKSVALGLVADPRDGKDTALLQALTSGTAEAVEEQNLALSRALEDDFANWGLHEKAALLLGAFTLREHTGEFLDIRWPLCRMTAHLAFARLLSGDKPAGLHGQIAEAMLETLMNNQTDALQKLAAIPSTEAPVAVWLRTLRARNTGDYRPLAALQNPTLLERVEWFRATAYSTDPDLGWRKLTDTEKQQVPDFARCANEENYSVEVGHQLLQVAIPLELAEITTVHKLSRGADLKPKELARTLNRMPERCFSTDDPKRAQIRVIGWGTWAAFLQRQLCHAVQANFDFMERKWSVQDDAKEFSTKCEEMFGELRFYPFVRRFNATTREQYHKAVNDGFKITVATPHLSPPQCWNYLCYRGPGGEVYQPNPNPHINEWHKHNPPPGTVYNVHPRLNHPSLVNRADTVQRLEGLLEKAPYENSVRNYLYKAKYRQKPTYDQAVALYRPILDYSSGAMAMVAYATEDNPARYEEWMLKAAAVNPDYYFTLATFFSQRDEAKAIGYFEKAVAAGGNSIRASTFASWAVRYYLAKGQTEKARQVADEAGEVYSGGGLAAKAEFLEATGKYAEAFEWYAKMEERYGQSGLLMRFCSRYKEKTGDGRFDAELQKRLRQLFSGEPKKVRLADLKGAPTDGVIVEEVNALTEEAGLKGGDIIVAAQGIRVHTFEQYDYARDSSASPELVLLVWQDGAYREIKASPPNHRFGADFATYRRK